MAGRLHPRGAHEDNHTPQRYCSALRLHCVGANLAATTTGVIREGCSANSDVDRLRRQHHRSSGPFHVVESARRSTVWRERNGAGGNARVDGAIRNSAKRRIIDRRTRSNNDRCWHWRHGVDRRRHSGNGRRRIQSRERNRNTIELSRDGSGRNVHQRRNLSAGRCRARQRRRGRRHNGRNEWIPPVGRRHELVVRPARADRRHHRSRTSESSRCADQRHQRRRGRPYAGVARAERAAGGWALSEIIQGSFLVLKGSWSSRIERRTR